jgi:hypothetical protein
MLPPADPPLMHMNYTPPHRSLSASLPVTIHNSPTTPATFPLHKSFSTAFPAAYTNSNMHINNSPLLHRPIASDHEKIEVAESPRRVPASSPLNLHEEGSLSGKLMRSQRAIKKLQTVCFTSVVQMGLKLRFRLFLWIK